MNNGNGDLAFKLEMSRYQATALQADNARLDHELKLLENFEQQTHQIEVRLGELAKEVRDLLRQMAFLPTAVANLTDAATKLANIIAASAQPTKPKPQNLRISRKAKR